MQICGIDYGSKLAGTTAFALLDTNTNKINIAVSEKKKDADDFVTHLVLEKQPDLIFIDAPLSLPKIYANLKACPLNVKTAQIKVIGTGDAWMFVTDSLNAEMSGSSGLCHDEHI